ncbi:ATP-binding protein [Streptomyces sp. HPF1205]|uniref:ATP-binding protein n=1 Tax=Streptomyces sp. HPF1205 TaxID=2873262 RepID=UPI001CED278D|nr:ATP-binding protein [Streptomyces sp. HPF1205]
MTTTGTRTAHLSADAAPHETEIVSRWPTAGRTVARARRELVDALTAWGLPELRDAAELVLSELVTNAVRHARSPRGRLIETRVRRLPDGRVRIEVHDANTDLPVPRASSDTDEGGRGLQLVDALTAHQWGVSGRTGVGKAVWAIVAGPGDGQRPGG